MRTAHAITTRLVAENGLYEPPSSSSGGAGITQLIGDVLAGPGIGTQTATVVRINGATVPTAGALTPGNVLQVLGAAALVYAALNLANPASVVGLLPVANIAPAGINGEVLTTVAGNTVWAPAPSGTGITQLTGDVTAGPGSGSQPATVVKINGATVPISGALIIGSVLQVSGAASLQYGPVDLSSGVAVTNELPVANIAPSGTNGFVLTTVAGATTWAAPASGGITQLTGDVTAGPGSGSQASTVVQITGAAGVANVVSGTDLDFLQSGFTTSANGRLNFVADAAQVLVGIHRAGVDYSLISTDGAGDIFFGSGTLAGTFDVALIGPSNNSITIGSTGSVINSTKLTVNSTPTFFDSASNVTIGATTADFGGGAGLLAFAPITTAPTAAPATNGLVYQDAIGLHYAAPNATFAYLTDFMLAPHWQGTNDTQASIVREYAGEVSTTTSVEIIEIPVPTNKVISISCFATARDVSGGTVGDGATIAQIFQFRNVAGTVTQAATEPPGQLACDASMAAVTLTGFVSGTNAFIQVNNNTVTGAPTVDWTCIARVIVN